ncbi:hypothetical protein [Aurantiacibacter luteus]|uniref:Uncharacterized protein n=1 Tax=Aurantiacibacter luteus TaxID=1581420 RepID=A0A0G9MWZ9_9SPHN|nr:hypothetical protein [Aurantiacibacter luteus]KLE35251.1 hypothetical protein AAW00_01905 [Aurantiacibacter luteus]
MFRRIAYPLAAALLAVPFGAQAQQRLPDFQLPPNPSSTPDPRQGPELPPVPRATPTPTPMPVATPTRAPSPTATPSPRQDTPAPVQTRQATPQPRATASATSRVGEPRETAPAPIASPETAASPEPTPALPSAAATPAPAPVVAAPTAPVVAEDEGGGWTVLWWLLGLLLVAGVAGYAFLRWKFAREETVVVERIQPYRPLTVSAATPAAEQPQPRPEAAPQPSRAAQFVTSPSGFVQIQRPTLGGVVAAGNGKAAPAGTVQVSRPVRPPAPAPAPVPNDGGVYARPIRRS